MSHFQIDYGYRRIQVLVLTSWILNTAETQQIVNINLTLLLCFPGGEITPYTIVMVTV